MRLLDQDFELFLTQAEIESAIAAMARQLAEDYRGTCPLFVGVLNGCFRFAAELFKYYDAPCEVSFVKMASYQGLTSTGIVETLLDVSESVEGRDVVILEDIVDSGKTLAYLYDMLYEAKVLSVTSVAFLYKPMAIKYPIQPDYHCFSITNEFVIGYGLDYNEQGRQLSHLYQLTEKPII